MLRQDLGLPPEWVQVQAKVLCKAIRRALGQALEQADCPDIGDAAGCTEYVSEPLQVARHTWVKRMTELDQVLVLVLVLGWVHLELDQ